MENTICREFELYIQEAENIFDIMAAAYKLLSPFENSMYRKVDSSLQSMIFCFAQEYNEIHAMKVLKSRLTEWIHSLYESGQKEIKAELFGLIRLIDRKCVGKVKKSLPDPYICFYSLSNLFQDEIVILPRPQDGAMKLLERTIASQEGNVFFGRNYSKTEDVSGFIHNFIIYRRTHEIKPRITVLNYDKQLRDELEQKDYSLVVAVFPLSNRNLEKMFRVEKNIIDERGTFCISGVDEKQERVLLGRCINALEICRSQGVDIAVFPEMLFTENNRKKLMKYVREHENPTNRFPWFTWLGTAWSRNENKCMVMDQYGNEVFVQKKRVPYEYRENVKGKKVKLAEDLSYDGEWIVNFLDLSGFLRIATAICRDISDNYLRAAIKELYSDMVIIPAFSSVDRLTDVCIKPLILAHINAIICNACSACCPDDEEQYEINVELMENPMPFCYLGMTAKEADRNTEEFHRAAYRMSCIHCEHGCRGFLWKIDFKECVAHEGKYTAKVVSLDL